MQRECLLYSLIAGFGFLSGCINPMRTEMPQWEARSPSFERQSIERMDPFPDSAIGPETYTRPRGFMTQRSKPRRDLEGGMLYAPVPVPNGTTPQSSALGSKYPQAVRP